LVVAKLEEDFMFQLTNEAERILMSQMVISNSNAKTDLVGHGGEDKRIGFRIGQK
jgi:hypothetical protein